MAGSMNKAILVGRLGQDPKLAYSASGVAVANFSLATDESYTDREGNKVEKTEWHRIVVFGKQAEFCSNYLSKGRLVLVEGSLQTDKWQDPQGVEKFFTKIKANRVQFLDSKPQGQSGQSYVPAPDQEEQQPEKQEKKEKDSKEQMGPAFPSEAGGMDDAPF